VDVFLEVFCELSPERVIATAFVTLPPVIWLISAFKKLKENSLASLG
jgi:hypothetical protein